MRSLMTYNLIDWKGMRVGRVARYLGVDRRNDAVVVFLLSGKQGLTIHTLEPERAVGLIVRQQWPVLPIQRRRAYVSNVAW